MTAMARHLLAALLLWAVQAGDAWADPFRVNSGKVLDIVSIKPEATAKGRALVMVFGTKTPLTDIPGLRIEADELWEHFVVNVERAGHSRAVIRATNGGGAPVDFVYVKRGGDWRTLEKELGPGGTLTEEFIKESFEHGILAAEHMGRNATELYLARDWTITYTYPPQLGIPPITVDRVRVYEMNRQLQARMGDQRPQRQISLNKIEIAPNGKFASIQILYTGVANINGRVIQMTGHIVNSIAVQDGAVISLESHMVVREMNFSTDL